MNCSVGKELNIVIVVVEVGGGGKNEGKNVVQQTQKICALYVRIL